MRITGFVHAFAAFVFGTLVAVAGAARAGDHDLALYHRFTVPAAGEWGAIAIDLAPGGWRVDAIDGPPATEQQLRSTLGRLAGITIGGRCTIRVEGPTSYPCTVWLRGLDLGGLVGPQFAAGADGQLPTMTGLTPADVNGIDHQAAPGGARPAGIQTEFAGLAVPPPYLGDQRAAFGRQLRFELRLTSNRIAPSRIDPGSGTVILRRAPEATMPGRSSALPAAHRPA